MNMTSAVTFLLVLTRRHLTEFVVLDVEPVDMRTISVAAHAQRFIDVDAKRSRTVNSHQLDSNVMMHDQRPGPSQSARNNIVFSDPRCDPLAGRLVDVEVARVSDFGVNDTRAVVRSHLGHVLAVGDWFLGYDLARLNLAGLDEDKGIDSIVSVFVRGSVGG